LRKVELAVSTHDPPLDYLRSSPELIASPKCSAVNETAQLLCVCLQR
jgi:hypothetical protein